MTKRKPRRPGGVLAEPTWQSGNTWFYCTSQTLWRFVTALRRVYRHHFSDSVCGELVYLELLSKCPPLEDPRLTLVKRGFAQHSHLGGGKGLSPEGCCWNPTWQMQRCQQAPSRLLSLSPARCPVSRSRLALLTSSDSQPTARTSGADTRRNQPDNCRLTSRPAAFTRFHSGALPQWLFSLTPL